LLSVELDTPALIVTSLSVRNCDFSIRERYRVGCARRHREAEQQQAAQIHDGPARRLAVHTVGSFFSTPLLGDQPKLRLVVDNDRSKTAP
jgi:hypothetical protein